MQILKRIFFTVKNNIFFVFTLIIVYLILLRKHGVLYNMYEIIFKESYYNKQILLLKKKINNHYNHFKLMDARNEDYLEELQYVHYNILPNYNKYQVKIIDCEE